MIQLADPQTRVPLPAFAPFDRRLRPLSIYADLDYYRAETNDPPINKPIPDEDDSPEPKNDPVNEPEPPKEPQP